MEDKDKTPWRKNLDPRYISGEDLQNGLAMKKGLSPEIIVTVADFKDVPTFDQNKQTEVDKTAIWLKDVKSGQLLYKPCILNVTRGTFLSKEIGAGSPYIEDFDQAKPFIIYSKPDKRHGYVVAFKKYVLPTLIQGTEQFKNCKTALKGGTATMEKIKARYFVSEGVEKLLLAEE